MLFFEGTLLLFGADLYDSIKLHSELDRLIIVWVQFCKAQCEIIDILWHLPQLCCFLGLLKRQTGVIIRTVFKWNVSFAVGGSVTAEH